MNRILCVNVRAGFDSFLNLLDVNYSARASTYHHAIPSTKSEREPGPLLLGSAHQPERRLYSVRC